MNLIQFGCGARLKSSAVKVWLRASHQCGPGPILKMIRGIDRKNTKTTTTGIYRPRNLALLINYAKLQHCNKLEKHVIINKVLAFVMLLIFIFSITPKKYFHDLVADHTDYYAFVQGDETVVSKAGFNCHCENPVVSTPFIESSIEQARDSEIQYQEFSYNLYHFYFLSFNTTEDLRGPPSLFS